MGFAGESAASAQLAQLLDAVDGGALPGSVERRHVDVKEEPGRRGRRGEILRGPADPEAVAQMLHAELACMANTPGGGAVVLGLGDDGARLGVTVDGETLRHRVYQLSGRRMTPEVRPHHLADGTEVLLCTVFQAVEPVRVEAKIHWRVDDHCVEVDPSTWFGKLGHMDHDWSAESSDRDFGAVAPDAVAELRRLLRSSGEQRSLELAGLADLALLRRVTGVLTDGDVLTNAGRLLLTDVPPAIDYVHRPYGGADSTVRIEEPGPLLLQLRRVTDAITARARTIHVPVAGSAAVSQLPALPPRPLREAIMNALLHREWLSPRPTRVEHVGDTLMVESPGGLIGTVTPANIITHPPTPRHRCLAEVAAKIRLVEREGVGVDRMYADLIALGRPAPIIEELPGPRVAVRLIGGEPEGEWIRFLAALDSPADSADLNTTMALDLVSQRGWISATSLAPVIQDHVQVAADTLARLERATSDGTPVLQRVKGQPEAAPPAYRLSTSSRVALRARTAKAGAADSRSTLFVEYARDTGRISSTEAADLSGTTSAPAADVLKQLAAEGSLVPSSPYGVGRGFHYRPTAIS